MKRHGLVAACLFVLFHFGAAGQAEDLAQVYKTQTFGGPGGAPFMTDCGPDGVLIGIIGRAGTLVDSIKGLCVKVDPVFARWVGPVYETGTVGGGGGGNPFTFRCPQKAFEQNWPVMLIYEGSSNRIIGVQVMR